MDPTTDIIAVLKTPIDCAVFQPARTISSRDYRIPYHLEEKSYPCLHRIFAYKSVALDVEITPKAIDRHGG